MSQEFEEQDFGKTEARGKMQKTEGDFSVDVLLKDRVELWMNEQDGGNEQQPKRPISYKEAVKPSKNNGVDQEDMWMKKEDWDGSLLISNDEEMKRGISITNTEQGPHIVILMERGGESVKNGRTH